MQPIDKDDEHPTNIWGVVGDVASDTLSYTMKTKITFDAVLFQVCNFCSWFEDSVCQEIMDTVYQMQERKNEAGDGDDETLFFTTLKLAVTRRQFLVFEKFTLHPMN